MIEQYHKSSISLLDCKIELVDKELLDDLEDREGDTFKLEVTSQGEIRLIVEGECLRPVIRVTLNPESFLAMARYLAWAHKCVVEDEEDQL